MPVGTPPALQYSSKKEKLVTSLKSQVSSLKSQVSSLKSQVSSLKSQVSSPSSLKSQVSSLKSQVSSLKSQVSKRATKGRPVGWRFAYPTYTKPSKPESGVACLLPLVSCLLFLISCLLSLNFPAAYLHRPPLSFFLYPLSLSSLILPLATCGRVLCRLKNICLPVGNHLCKMDKSHKNKT